MADAPGSMQGSAQGTEHEPSGGKVQLQAVPLTAEAFRPFGQVVGWTEDGKKYDKQDAQLKLDAGTPRYVGCCPWAQADGGHVRFKGSRCRNEPAAPRAPNAKRMTASIVTASADCWAAALLGCHLPQAARSTWLPPNTRSPTAARGHGRFYIMRLPARGLTFHRITYHGKVTQCLGAVTPSDW